MLDCISNQLRSTLEGAGVGTFEVVPAHYMEGNEYLQSGSRLIKHTAPDGETASAAAVSTRYRLLDPVEVFGPIMTALQSEYGGDPGSIECKVVWRKVANQRVPVSVSMKIDLMVSLPEAPRRGDLYKVSLVVTDNYFGTGRAHAQVVIFRVSCLNLEIFDTTTLFNWSVTHKGGQIDLTSLWKKMPTNAEIRSTVAAFYTSIEGLDGIMLDRSQFARALHYVLHGEVTSLRLLSARQHWMTKTPMLDRTTGRTRPSMTEDAYGVTALPPAPGKVRSGKFLDVISASPVRCSGKSLSKTVQVVSDWAKQHGAPEALRVGYESRMTSLTEDGGHTAYGLRQCLTSYLGATAKGYVPNPNRVRRLVETLDMVKDRAASDTENSYLMSCGASRASHYVPLVFGSDTQNYGHTVDGELG
jgi:hypothetical protein